MSIWGNPIMMGGSGGGGGGITILSGADAPTPAEGTNRQTYLEYQTLENLPSGYVQLDYIEVETAGPYIDTGKAGNSQAYWAVDAQYTAAPGNNYGIFGAFGTGGREFLVNSYGGVSYVNANYSNNRAVFTSTQLDRHLFEAKADGLYIDGVKSAAAVDWASAPNINYYIFAFNYAEGSPYIFKTANARVYSVKIYDGSTLSNHLVPCKRISDDTIGMYDVIQQAFRTNAGTGSFVAGPEAGEAVKSAFVKVNGTWQDLIGTDINDIDLGGGGTIVPKTITTNGTYNASTDNADGYNPVVVNVSGGGPFERWDFTGSDPRIGKLRGLTLTQNNITFDSSGANFLTTTSRLSVPVWANFAVEIDVASMSLSGGTNRRFIMGETQEGLVYRSTGYWGFYTYSGTWEMFPESSGSLFSGSTVRVEIDTNNKWHIYKDGVLLYEPSASLPVSSFQLGSTDAASAINNAVISAMRFY